MVLKVLSPKAGNISASDYVSDPEDKEFSDDDDGDRNHKHRRRDARAESSDKDALEQTATRTYRKHNKSFGNGNGFKESESQSSQLHNNYNTSSERNFPGKFEKRNPDFGRAHFGLNHRNRANQPFFGDPGPGRGRGRDSGGAWNNRHYRFMTADLSSQIVPLPRGNMASSLFPERGLPVPNVQGTPWGGYGLVPGLPNGGLDPLHSIGLQGPFRPPISNPLGIPRQRCRDFEERGFCLRGDMCPMEHGINRIVVDDVQSLSQFNLPVSLSSGGQLLGPPAMPGSLPSVAVSSSLMNNRGPHRRNGKQTVGDETLVSNGSFSDTGNGTGADVYDPDQPLWNNNVPEKSSAHAVLHSSPFSETESLLNDDLPDHPITETAGIEQQDRNNLPVGSGSSVWGRMRSSRGKVNVKREALDNGEGQIKEIEGATSNATGSFNHGKQIIADGAVTKALDPSKVQSGFARLTRRPTQKALRTLFVNGVPQKNNRRDALLSHFKKFGKVINIHIPTNTERAFVQFSKREEAEAALNSPDAVMGNRFIKLWWANRDNIPDNGINGVSGISSQHGVKSSSALPDISAPNKGKDNCQSGALISDGPGSHPDQSKLSTPGPKVPPPLQNKLEQLKEELRKKQEMLDQKRNDFKRQLDKLEKATGVKGDVSDEQVSKKQKVEAAADDAKAAAVRSTDSAAVAVASSHEDVMDSKTKLVEVTTPGRPDTKSSFGPQHPFNLRQQSHSSAPTSMPFPPYRYKLDNRPTSFRIIPPLPTGFTNVDTLKEHFASHGDVTVVELEDRENHDEEAANGGVGTVEKCSASAARIGFRERHSAERAFVNGKCWQGHYLQFFWIPNPTSTAAAGIDKPSSSSSSSSSATKEPSDTITAAEKVVVASSDESERGESEPPEREKPEEHHVELDEASVSDPTSLSSAEGQQKSPQR